MIVENTTPAPPFTPVTLKITFTTEVELRTLANILANQLGNNSTLTMDLFKALDGALK